MTEDEWLEDVDWLHEGANHPFTVRSIAAIHDQRQFQIKFEYDSNLVPGDLQKIVNTEIYLFIPASIGISSRTYTKEQFFSAITNYLRIKTPRKPFWFESWETLSIPSADLYLNLTTTTSNRIQIEPQVIQDVKLYGCYINTIFKSLHLSIEGGIKTDLRVFRRRVEDIQQRIQIFRQKYVGAIQRFSSLTSPDVRKAFLLLDEYLSYRLEFWILEFLKDLEGQTDEASLSLTEFLKKLVDKEVYHRSRYILPLDPQSSGRSTGSIVGQEHLHYRLGLLKKYVYSVLYLRQTQVRREKVLFNFVAMIGAFVAATFYGIATYSQMSMVRDAENTLRLVALFALGILAYVLKDRLKELTRDYFFRKFRRYLPDLLYQLDYSTWEGRGQRSEISIGELSQNMQFVGRNTVPADILYIRDLESNFDLEPQRQEEILHFHRRLAFTHDQGGKRRMNVSFVKEVLRLDVSDYLGKMSDPLRSFKFWKEDSGIQEAQVPRVYHVNAVVRYMVTRFGEDGKKRRHIEYERLRLVMDKHGIVRIDTVLPKGELRLEETA